MLQGGDAHSAENQKQFSQIQFAGTDLARSKKEAQSTKKKYYPLRATADPNLVWRKRLQYEH